MSITEFLLARIADDEAIARDEVAQYESVGQRPPRPLGLISELGWVGVGFMSDPAIAIDTTRVLAECAAKRAIVERHDSDAWDFACEAEGRGRPNPDACQDLRALAAIYADHPDYRDEWEADA